MVAVIVAAAFDIKRTCRAPVVKLIPKFPVTGPVFVADEYHVAWSAEYSIVSVAAALVFPDAEQYCAHCLDRVCAAGREAPSRILLGPTDGLIPVFPFAVVGILSTSGRRSQAHLRRRDRWVRNASIGGNS
jgi:hypothetical protein